MKNIINWFEIPVNDFERGKKFYEQILGVTIQPHESMGFTMGVFSHDEGVSGAIIKGNNCVPSEKGVLVYLNGEPDLNGILQRVEPAGGKVLIQKTLISPEIGNFGVFIDSEGNRLGVFSRK